MLRLFYIPRMLNTLERMEVWLSEFFLSNRVWIHNFFDLNKTLVTLALFLHLFASIQIQIGFFFDAWVMEFHTIEELLMMKDWNEIVIMEIYVKAVYFVT